jgi:hypothetical protein
MVAFAVSIVGFSMVEFGVIFLKLISWLTLDKTGLRQRNPVAGSVDGGFRGCPHCGGSYTSAESTTR